jgi:two-component system OmpR family response regulator
VRVLLIEDDVSLARVLERGLRAHGFEVASVHSGDDVVARTRDAAVAIVLVDVPLSRADGRVLLEQVSAARSDLPMLYLTARNEVATMARAMHANSEDFLAKPFALEELIATVRARTRGENEPRQTMLSAGDLRMDLLARCAWIGDQIVDLPSREFALLEYFVRHPGRVLSRQSILTDVWGYDSDPASNVVDVYVRYLRSKLADTTAGNYIVTERRAGYRFDPSAAPPRPSEASASRSSSAYGR